MLPDLPLQYQSYELFRNKLITSGLPRNRLKWLVFAFVVLILTACSGEEYTANKGQPAGSATFAMPNALQVAALPKICSGTLEAYITIDADPPVPMTIRAQDGKAVYRITEKQLGEHTFKIDFQCRTTQVVVLASASKKLDIIDGPNIVSFSNNDYLPLLDTDGDKISNLNELISGTDPFTIPTIPDTTPPTTPTQLLADDITSKSIQLTWTRASDLESAVVGYKIYRNNIFLADDVDPPYFDDGLSPDTAYTYTVAAVNEVALEGSQSTELVVSTSPVIDITPPTQPGTPQASDITENSLELSWTPASDAESGISGYKVYRDNTVVGTPTIPSFTDSGLAGSTSYSYQVAAINGELINGPRSDASLFTTTTPITPIDSTPPSAPGDPIEGTVTAQSIEFSWAAANDPDSQIVEYTVYRDGIIVATVITLSFVDTDVLAATTYTYQVSALSGAPEQGPLSAAIPMTTLAGPGPDSTPPDLVSTTTGNDATLVTVAFSEALDQQSATTISNYTITPNITIVSASLSSDLTTVTLTTSPLVAGIQYDLSVSNVTDIATTANTITANSTQSFSYLISATSRVGYQWDIAALDSPVNTDTGYVYEILPAEVLGQSYLPTVDADKIIATARFLDFTVSQAVIVYVAYDVNSPPPIWLGTRNGWQDSGLTATIEINNTTTEIFQLFSQSFPAGLIELDNQGDALLMYGVFVAPDLTVVAQNVIPNETIPLSTDSSATPNASSLIIIGVP